MLKSLNLTYVVFLFFSFLDFLDLVSTLESLLDISEGARGVPPDIAAFAEPNLGALLGISGPLATGGTGGLLRGLGNNQLPVNGGINSPNLQTIHDSNSLGNLCNSGANSDALSNLLVYQYLSGSLPSSQGTTAVSNNPNVPRSDVGRSQFKALLPSGPRESKTVTTVTTTLTTRTITMDASTRFSTTTTSYVTTITSVTSSVLPIIFRGSKITTTITDRVTDVLTATEFHTSSSVFTPSIIQTLNVHVTLTQTSTKGINGHFTLVHVSPGESKIIEEPISSTTHNFDTQGINLGSLNQRGGNSGVVNALTAFLKQYNGDGNSKANARLPGRSRFSQREEDPKFNVIKGFTLKDKEIPKKEQDNSGGSALENTRYSKFRKKSKSDSKNLADSKPDRDTGRFSASRRTVSRERRPDINRRDRDRRRNYSRSRINRETKPVILHRSGRTLNYPTPKDNFVRDLPEKVQPVFRSTLLTLHISGAKRGEVITTVRTVTLRGYNTERFKRQINPSVPKPKIIARTKLSEQPFGPKEVVGLLQNLDRRVVKNMLYNLRNWVNYYLHQVLDESIDTSFILGLNTIENNRIPLQLHSSQIEDELSAMSQATLALDSISNAITKDSIKHYSSEHCSISTVTETVYKTVYASNYVNLL